MSQTPQPHSDRNQPMAANGDLDSWWKHGVIYQIYPRSFQDNNGDGVGDIVGITSRLPYLQSLGVTAIWISPFFKSPMKDFGYDVENHRDIDPLFGNLDDFDNLIEQAHTCGIRIMIDLVLSHTADTHAWFESARSGRGSQWEDCFVWADPKEDGGPPNNWLSVFGGPSWTFEPKRNQYYLHNFLDSQPDLNFHSPTVQKEALAIAQWWLERGVDGFRLDTVNFYFHDRALRDNPIAPHPDDQVVTADNPYSLQDHIHDKNQPQVCGFLSDLGSLLAEYPGSIALGEVGATEERARDLMQQYQQPGRLHLCYTFDLLSPQYSANHFRKVLARDATEASDVWRCIAFSNHDVQRAATRLNLTEAPTEALASNAVALLLSLRGTPCIYQGEELGLTEANIPYDELVDPYGIAFWPKYKGRDGCRTPMPWQHDHAQAGFTESSHKPWLPIPAEHREKAANLQQEKTDSLFQQTKELIAIHRHHAAFHSEHIDVLDSPDELLVFERGTGEESILCVFNLSDKAIDFATPSKWCRASTLQCGGTIHTETDQDTSRYEPWSWCLLASQSNAC